MNKIVLQPIEFERHELSKLKAWAEDTIKFIIEQTPLMTDCEVSEVHFHPIYTQGKVKVEMKVNKTE